MCETTPTIIGNKIERWYNTIVILAHYKCYNMKQVLL